MCSSATEKKREGERKGEGEWEMAANKGEVFCLPSPGDIWARDALHRMPTRVSLFLGHWTPAHSPGGSEWKERERETHTHTHTQFSHHSNTNYNFLFFFLCFFLCFFLSLNLVSYMYGCIYTITTTVIIIMVVVIIYLFILILHVYFIYLFLC